MSDRQRLTTFVLIVSIVLILVGGVGLISTVTVASPVDTVKVSCGSSLAPDDAPAKKAGQDADEEFIRAGGGLSLTRDSARDNINACGEARAGRGAWTWPLLGLGLISLLGWLFLRRSAPDQAASEDAST